VQWVNLIGPLPKKVESMKALQNKRFYGMECPLLCPRYIREKGRTLGKTYGMKAMCYWEHLWGTWWELEGNMKKTLSTQPKIWKKKNHCNLSLSIGWMKFLFPKLFVATLAWANTPIINLFGHIFILDLIALSICCGQTIFRHTFLTALATR